MKTITFLIPFYNESKRLNKTFKALKTTRIPKELQLEEIIFVNDGSTDRSVELIKNAKRAIEKNLKAKITILSYPVNKGKGHAVKVGMLSSRSNYTLFFDADLSTPIEEIKKFLPLIRRDVDVIVGTRKNGESTVVKHQPWIREVLGRSFTVITQRFLRINVSDFTCGFKAFSYEAKEKVFSKATINRWGYDAEILYIASQMELKIEEKAVTWSDRKGSKIKLYKAIPQTFFDLLLIDFNHNLKPSLSFLKLNFSNKISSFF